MKTEERILEEIKKLRQEVIELQESIRGNNRNENSIEKNAKTILESFMLKKSSKGYKYIVDAIVIIIERNGDIMISKELYPYIAKKNNTTAGLVESSIRRQIKNSIDNCPKETINKYFPCFNGKMTNGEFLYGLADYIKIFC